MRTTQSLIDQVRILTNIPDNQQKFTNQQILDLANNELQGFIISKLMNTREEFYVVQHELSLNSRNKYRIPSRAIASKLRDVKFKRGEEVFDLPRIPPEEVLTDIESTGFPCGFYLEGAFIRLYPSMSTQTGDMIQAPFFLRPNRLVELSQIGIINAIDTDNNSVTVTTLPAAITTGSKVDLIKQDGQYDTLEFDIVVSSLSGTTVVLPEELPEDLEVGDYLCPKETAPVAQIPEEWYPLFTDRIVARVMQSQNDLEAFNIAQVKMEELNRAAEDLITPRIEGESEIITNDNWRSWGWY